MWLCSICRPAKEAGNDSGDEPCPAGRIYRRLSGRIRPQRGIVQREAAQISSAEQKPVDTLQECM
jgi:hypothetical protein